MALKLPRRLFIFFFLKLQSHFHIKAPSCKSHIRQFFMKSGGMWLSCGSYGVYLAVTGSMSHFFFSWKLPCVALRVLRDGLKWRWHVAILWQLRGLLGCYRVYLAVTGSMSHFFLSWKLPCVALTGWPELKVGCGSYGVYVAVTGSMGAFIITFLG